MPVVTNTLHRPDGSPAAGALVTVRLIASLEGSGPGYVAGDQASVLDRWVTKAGGDGSWLVDLVANVDVVPAGTVYEVVEAVSGRPTVVQHIAVPAGVGPHWVGDILTEAPASLPSSALAGHVDNVTDAHDVQARIAAEAAVRAAADDGEAAARLAHEGATTAAHGIGRTPNVVFDGDSLTLGVGAGASPGRDYPSQTVIGLNARTTWTNLGVGGQTVPFFRDRAAATVDPLLVAGALNVAVLRAGTNDLYFSDGSVLPGTVHDGIVTYCNARRAAGWRVVVCTITPRSNVGTPANFEANRQALNTLIRDNWATYADGLADIGGDARLGVAGADTNKQYYLDLVHHTDDGYRISADIVRRAIGRIGIVAVQPPALQPPSLWLPARLFDAAAGTAPISVDSFSNRVWRFPDGAVNLISAPLQLPQDWTRVHIDVMWGKASAVVGNCHWRIDRAEIADNVGFSVFGDSAFVVDFGYATGLARVTQVRTNMALRGGSIYTLRVWREGNAAVDTLAGDADFLGCRLRRAA